MLYVTLYDINNIKNAQQLTYLNTCNLDHKHCCPEHMPSIVAPEFDTSNLCLLVKVDSLNTVHTGLYVFLRVQHLLRGNIAHFDII